MRANYYCGETFYLQQPVTQDIVMEALYTFSYLSSC